MDRLPPEKPPPPPRDMPLDIELGRLPLDKLPMLREDPPPKLLELMLGRL